MTDAPRFRRAPMLRFKRWLQYQAERGLANSRRDALTRELVTELEHLVTSGHGTFPSSCEAISAKTLLQLDYICLQYERLIDDGGETAASLLLEY